MLFQQRGTSDWLPSARPRGSPPDHGEVPFALGLLVWDVGGAIGAFASGWATDRSDREPRDSLPCHRVPDIPRLGFTAQLPLVRHLCSSAPSTDAADQNSRPAAGGK